MLSSADAGELLRAVEAEKRRRGSSYCPHTPHPPQARFLSLTCREALYGGAAGGGKSDALLMAALQYVHVPGYAALILRRTFTDLALPGAIMDRSHTWLRGSDAHWNDNLKTWKFPSGARLVFGYLQHEADKYHYQGPEFHFIGFDELTQFSRTQYLYLNGRIRRLEGSRVPSRTRGASNPGGFGHDWVKERFVDDGAAAKGRIFIPAKLEDNPSLDREDYEASLAELDPVTRAQLRHGDWTVRPQGPMFSRDWFGYVDEAPAEATRVRYWDLAATEDAPGKDPDWTRGTKIALKDGVWYVEDLRSKRGRPKAVEDMVRQTAEDDGRRVRIRMEQEPGSSGVSLIDHYARAVLVGYDFKGDKKTGNKIELARPLSSAAEAGNVKLVRGAWNSEFLDEVCAFPFAGHDDIVDSASGAQRALSSPRASYDGIDQRTLAGRRM